MPKKITERTVGALKCPGPGPRFYWDKDKDPMGFGVRVFPTGRRAFVLGYTADGRRRVITLGDWPALSVAEARDEARAKRQHVRGGGDPIQDKVRAERDVAVAAERTVGAVVGRFLEQHAARLRSKDEVKRNLDLYVLPRWRDRAIDTIRRSEVAALLDDVAAGRVEGQRGGGAAMADHVLAWLTKLFNWWAARDDDFVSPIRRGMRRNSPKATARDRVLTDAELRALWGATEGSVYGALLRTVLLTGQRPGTGKRGGEVSAMRRSEIGEDGTWTIPEGRSKTGRALHVPLSDMARVVIDAVPKVEVDGAESDLVFTLDGRRPIGGFSKPKHAVDEAMAEALERDGDPFTPWRVHDLRRTARTLMSRAGVPDRHAEVLLGHVIPGIEGVYNRHGYEREKREAAEALAAMVRCILANRDAEVVPIKGGRRRGRK